MATHHTNSRSPRTASLLAFAPFLPCARPLDQAAVLFSDILCALTGEILRLLPFIILTACQSFGAFVLDHAQSFGCVQILVSAWSVAQFLIGQ